MGLTAKIAITYAFVAGVIALLCHSYLVSAANNPQVALRRMRGEWTNSENVTLAAFLLLGGSAGLAAIVAVMLAIWA